MQILDRPPLSPSDRVRLRPHLTLLRRDENEIQLGVDTTDAVVLSDPDGRLSAALEVMDGRYRLRDLLAAGEQLGWSRARLSDLLTTLGAAGLLQPEVPGDLETCSVRLVGLGPAGVLIGEQLLRAGLGRLVVVDPDASVRYGTWPVDHAAPNQARSLNRVQVADHWSKPDHASVDLTVVVTSRLEIDRAVSAGLSQADHPHLVVRPRARGAIVGPLIIPGRTSCLRCGDLVRTRSDPAWPRMLAQLCRITGQWDPLAADWAAALVTTQLLGHLAGRTVETAAATLELGPVGWSWERRLWPADPACGCCWSPRAEW